MRQPRMSVSDRIEYALIKKRKDMKKRHDARRAAGACIQGAKHGRAFKGGRCKPCWERKLSAERVNPPRRVAA